MRSGVLAVLIAAVAAVAGHAEARTVPVHVVSSSCSAAVLRATSSSGNAVERRWSGGDISFDLDDGAWTIAATAPGCWAVPADTGAGAVKITLWPAATLRFRLEEPRDALVHVRVSSADGKIAPAAIECAPDGGARTCSVPATPLDVRIGADGFVPLYLWGKEISPHSGIDLGALRLTRGASVSGRVTVPWKDPKLDGVTVQLAPAAMATITGDSARRALLTQTAKTNRRGFFQFAGVAEGNYTLVARAEGWSPAAENDVPVVTGAEVVLPKPMVLTPLAKFVVTIDPPADAGGKPWHVKMVRTWPQTDPPIVIRGTASPAGDWGGSNLEGGRYNLSVDDAGGSVFHRQFVDVADGAAPLHVSIGSFRVQGRVTFRGEPLQCGIWLTQPVDATASIRLRSDREGKFEVVLPEEATWRVQLITGNTYAHLQPVEIRRRSDGAPVQIELALPAGRVRGKAVDEKGEPVPASIMIWKEGRPLASTWTSDGTFDMRGVEPADVTLHAVNDALDRDGGSLPLRVSEAGDDPLTILMAKRKKVKAWLATPDGQPIAGALVRYVVAETIKEEISGPGGELTLPIPPNQSTVPVVILSPGLPRKIMMLNAGSEPSEIVVSPVGARLLLRHTPMRYTIDHDGVIIAGSLMFEPWSGIGRMRESTGNGWALDFEPGSYSICASFSRERCKTFALQAGTTTTVDVSEILK